MKKIIIQIIALLIIAFNSTFVLFGQEKVIHGKVTTFDSIPLIGVSVKVKSTKNVVSTDSLGIFTVFCSREDKLKISARGFYNQNVKTDDKTKYIFVNLKLKTGPEYRETAIGYMQEKDQDKLNEISGLSENDMDFSRYEDIYEIVRSRFPSVEISGSKDIIIRGSQTHLGSDAALLVVDGVVVSKDYFGSIPTSDVASINVLKGADASGYGSRGANGVVLVETKSVKKR